MYDLIICVYACDTIEKYKNQILKMNETYVRLLDQYKNIKLVYFLGEEKTDLQGDQYVNLPNVNNDYLSASYKQFLGLKYIFDNFKTKFVMCIGTDTYLNIKKLDSFLQNYNSNENLYIGGHGDYRMIDNTNTFFHSGGPGFILTYTCLKLIYPHLETFMEKWIDICNKNNIQNLIPACDVGIAYLINLPEINATTIHAPDSVFMHCNYLGIPCHPNRINYNNLISCHSMSLLDFDNFTHLLENNNYYM